MVQFALMASEAGQLLVSAKFVELKVTLMELIVSEAVPVLVSVTVCAALIEPTFVLGKFALFDESVTRPASTPVPLSGTLCGLPGPLSVKINEPLRVPAVVGVNVTKTVQDAVDAKLVPQLFVCAKSPLVAILPIVSVPAPLLVRVTFCAALVTFTGSLVEDQARGVEAHSRSGVDTYARQVGRLRTRVYLGIVGD